jgi:hypothetical protein
MVYREMPQHVGVFDAYVNERAAALVCPPIC